MSMNEIKNLEKCCEVFSRMINDLEERREKFEDECGFTPFLNSKRIEERKKHRESKYRVLKEPVGKIRSRAELSKHELEMLDIIEKAIGRKLLDDKKSSCRPHTININELFDDDDEKINELFYDEDFIPTEKEIENEIKNLDIKNPIEDEIEFRRSIGMEFKPFNPNDYTKYTKKK